MAAEAIHAASQAFTKALIERALSGEMNHHLGYPSGGVKPEAVTNQRNSTGARTVLTDKGAIRIDVSRDREGSFTPLLIPKHTRCFTGFDDKIIALYARGMTVREIQGLRNAALNFSFLRRLAINLFRADTSRSISLPKKRKAAAWNPDCLATVLKLRGI
jgi:transposase-like protein